MKIMVPCQQCLRESIASGSIPETRFYRHDFNDNDTYIVTCDKGHVSATCHQSTRFEILIDFGLWALVLGLEDAAYLRFYSAFEDFRAFFIRCWLHSQNITQEEIRGVIGKIKRSEQQKGAFTLLNQLLAKTHPTSVPKQPNVDRLTELRNKISHAGYIPTKDEVTSSCQSIMNYIVDTVIWLRTFMPDAIQAACMDILLERSEGIRQSGFAGAIGTLSGPTAINLSVQDIKRISIKEGMSVVSENDFFVKPNL